MEGFILEIGCLIKWMVSEKLNGSMEKAMKGNIKMIKSMEKEFFIGMMEKNMLGFGMMENSME